MKTLHCPMQKVASIKWQYLHLIRSCGLVFPPNELVWAIFASWRKSANATVTFFVLQSSDIFIVIVPVKGTVMQI